MRSVVLAAVGGVLFSAAVGLGLWSAVAGSEARAEDVEARAEIARVSEGLRRLDLAQAELRQRADELAGKLAELTALAVARERAQSVPASEPAPPTTTAPVAGRSQATLPPTDLAEEEFEEALEVLVDPHVRDSEKQAVWNRLAAAGRMDAAVAFFEERARESPEHADAHADLGHACIQKLLTVGDLEKATWMMKADGSYDRALELDERHWGARFSKALSYSYAPALFGLQPKAIEHLEILRAQQEEEAPQRKFAQTYLFLGNLYSHQGKREKAREIWTRGLEKFPESDELRRATEE